MSKSEFRFVLERIPQDWDSLLLTEWKYPHPQQSSAFAEYASKFNYFGQDSVEVSCLRILDRDKLVGASLFYTFRRSRKCCWMYGPLIHGDYLEREGQILRDLASFARGQSYRSIAFSRTQVAYGLTEVRRINDSGLDLVEGETPLIDLRLDMPTIQKTFHASVRKNIKKCQSSKLSIEFGDEPGLVRDYVRILKEFRKSRGFDLPALYVFSEAIEIFRRKNCWMKLALVRQGGQALAGLGFVGFGRIAMEVAVAQSDLYYQINLPAHDFIKGHVIETFKNQGLDFYDLAGGAKQASEKEAAILKFKHKFSNARASYWLVQPKYFGWSENLWRRMLSRGRKTFSFGRKCKQRLFPVRAQN